MRLLPTHLPVKSDRHLTVFFFVPKGLETFGGVGGDISQAKYTATSLLGSIDQQRKNYRILSCPFDDRKLVLVLLPMSSSGFVSLSMLSATFSEYVV